MSLPARQVRLRYLILITLRWLPVGLTIPVLVLLPLERGLTIAQAGVVTAVQGVTVMVLELPTGGFADALGRRPVLLLAGAVNLVSLSLYCVAHTVGFFAVAWMLQGVFRALDSGPLDSWFVDESLAADRNADIETGLSHGEVVLSLGIAGGALISGGLVWLGPIGPVSALTVPVALSILLSLLSTVAIAVLMHEERPALGLAALSASIRGVPIAIGSALRLARRSRVVLALIAVEILWSFGMVSFEKLMPIRLSEVLADKDAAASLMGPVSSAAWGASAAGAALIPLLVRRIGAPRTGFTLRLLQGATVVGMGVLAGPAGVVTGFLLTYAVHGAANPVHNALMHRQAEGEYRTSLLSLSSMASQPGFAIGAILLTAVAQSVSTSVAIVAGAIVLAAAAPLYLVKPKFHEPIDGGTSLTSALTPGGT
ncbi:MFS transporter [Actinoplanes sp. SE50]|uniref:MFS transporter n=1 Tax=unclassified Actinoplanes TaxID=2626549 RepID=UPI00023ED6BB|nr:MULTISPECIES: MFS transporter [unclassified Actinoplanes]AEV87379.1 major facilitator transporter [Actinoplanes sp. SE50/110]ATO85781.1 MFS transporter [Actinoplanes sp. SE50]SLM03194.1 MFS transporter [Actinoplanes sp. SE50/110]